MERGVDTVERRQVAVIASCAIALVLFDQSFVGVAYPFIGADVGANFDITSLLLTTYFVVAGSTMAIMGRVGDLVGLRRMIVIAFASFTAAEIVAAVAESPGLLLLARAICGLGIAGAITSGLALLSGTHPEGAMRRRAFSLWIVGTGAGSIAGALAGGFLGGGGWRAGFAIAAGAGVLIAVAATRLRARGETDRPIPRDLDVAGSALLVIGLMAILLALSQTNRLGWVVPPNPITIGGVVILPRWLPATPTLLGFGGLSLAAMAFVEVRRARRGRHAVLNPTLLRVPTFRTGLLVLVIITMISAGLLGASPLVTEYLFGFTAFDVSMVVISLAGGTLLGALVAFATANRIQGSKLLLIAIGALAFVLIACAALLLASQPVGHAYAAPLALVGVAVGMGLSSLTNVILRDVRPDELGLGVGLSQTAANVGAGAAVIVTMLLVSSFETLDVERMLARRHAAPSERAALMDATHFRPFDSSSLSTSRHAVGRPDAIWERPGLQREREILLRGIKVAFVSMLGIWTLLCAVAFFLARRLQAEARHS